MHLAFKDRTSDVYYLSLYSSTREWRTAAYNSGAPNIVAVY